MNYKNYLASISLIIFISLPGQTCTIVPDSFCSSMQTQLDYNIISGKIVSVDEDGIDVEVYHVLRGEELRDTIRIWDGTDFECNGPWSMAASDIGSVSDTIIISLPEIVGIENDWDVIGDYRRPDPYSYTSELKVSNGMALGLLYGDAWAPAGYNVFSFDYDLLVESLSAGLMCSDFISAIESIDFENAISFSNPVSANLTVNVSQAFNDLSLKIYATTGQLVEHIELEQSVHADVNLDFLRAGIYILEFKVGNRVVKQGKLIKV